MYSYRHGRPTAKIKIPAEVSTGIVLAHCTCPMTLIWKDEIGNCCHIAVCPLPKQDGEIANDMPSMWHADLNEPGMLNVLLSKSTAQQARIVLIRQ